MANQPSARALQLADAFYSIAYADHYMVGLIEPVTADELDEAEQLLIARQNAVQAYQLRKNYDLALDLLDAQRKKGQ